MRCKNKTPQIRKLIVANLGVIFLYFQSNKISESAFTFFKHCLSQKIKDCKFAN
jgi:hypothetical protein